MKNIKWNFWTVLLAVVLVILGVRVLARVFSWVWVLGSLVFNLLVWVAAVLLLVGLIRWLVLRLRGR